MENLTQPSVWPIFLAMLATAFGIERLIELMWNFGEWITLSTRRGRPADLKTASYLQFKSGVSVLLSAILGVILANMLNLHFFAALQQLAPGLYARCARQLGCGRHRPDHRRDGQADPRPDRTAGGAQELHEQRCHTPARGGGRGAWPTACSSWHRAKPSR